MQPLPNLFLPQPARLVPVPLLPQDLVELLLEPRHGRRQPVQQSFRALHALYALHHLTTKYSWEKCRAKAGYTVVFMMQVAYYGVSSGAAVGARGMGSMHENITRYEPVYARWGDRNLHPVKRRCTRIKTFACRTQRVKRQY